MAWLGSLFSLDLASYSPELPYAKRTELATSLARCRTVICGDTYNSARLAPVYLGTGPLVAALRALR